MLHSSNLQKRQAAIIPLQTGPGPGPSSTGMCLSRLESLPTELIQIIFFECLNLSLPRASPTIAAALSSFYVKYRLFLIAFSSAHWQLQYKRDLLNALFSYPEIDQLQTRILELRWMTLDFFYQCIPIYLEKELRDRYAVGEIDGEPAFSLTNEIAAKILRAAHQINGTEDLRQYYHTQTNCWFGTKRYLIGMALPDGQMTLHGPQYRYRPAWLYERMFSCLRDCRVPQKLLRGHWTDAKSHFLEIVTRGFATVNWTERRSGEAVDLGFREALKEHNTRVVRIFTSENDDAFSKLIDLDFDEYGTNAPRIFDTIGLGFKPTKTHLRLAAINYDCPLEILSMIMEAGHLQYCLRHDHALNAWARWKGQERDLRREWLLEYF